MGGKTGEREDIEDCNCLQERRKQQRRLFDAQQIQREMSQLERQYDELEEVGRDIEQALRDTEESKCDVIVMDLKRSLFSSESVNLFSSLPFHPSYI